MLIFADIYDIYYNSCIYKSTLVCDKEILYAVDYEVLNKQEISHPAATFKLFCTPAINNKCMTDILWYNIY